MVVAMLVALAYILWTYFGTKEERTLQVCEHKVNPFLGEHEFGDYLRCDWCYPTPFRES